MKVIDSENSSFKKLVFEKIYVCNNSLSRLRGVFFRGEFTDNHAVLLEGCSSVHGIGLTRPLDIIFLNKTRRVLAIKSLKPFGICRLRGARSGARSGAHSVLEIRSGHAERLSIEVNDYLDLRADPQCFKPSKSFMKRIGHSRQAGASMVEFLLIAPVLVYMGVGIVQMGMAYHARNVLDYATFEAARVGAVHQADVTEMRGELAYRLGPIFPGNGSNEGVRSAVTDAIIAVNDPLRTHIRIINPTSAVFEDFGVVDPDTGETVLPSAHLQYRSTDIGNRSRVTIQDANLLKIEVTHGYELRLPWLEVKLPGVDFVLKELMTLANPSNAQYYLRGQIPLRAVATIRMQSDALANNVEAASEGVTRPGTDELDLVNPPVVSEDQIIEEDHNDSGNTEEESQSDLTDGDVTETCTGSNGLPANLAITILPGESSEDSVCAIDHPEIPVIEPPVQDASPIDAGHEC